MMSWVRYGSVALVVVLVAVSVIGMGAAAPTDSEAEGDVIKLINQETGELYLVSADTDIRSADVPAGEYLAIYYEDGNRITETVTIEGDSALETQASSSIEIRSTIDREAWDYAHDSNGTVNIWAGAVNTSGNVSEPVSGVSIDINVTRPNGTVDQFTRTTGSDGNLVVAYNLSGKADGEYDVTVSPSDSSGTDYHHFAAGNQTRSISPGIAENVQIGEQVNTTILVSEDYGPVPGVTKTATITLPNGTQQTTTVTTDSSGYAELSFTPTQAGEYEVEVGSDRAWYTASNQTAKVLVNGDRFGDYITYNQTASIAGQVFDGDQPYTGETIQVRIVNTTQWDNETIAKNISVTTDSYGRFVTSWSPPEVADTEYVVRLYNAQGEQLAAGYNDIDVTAPPTESPGTTPSGGNQLDVDASLGDSWDTTVKPGGTVEAHIHVTEGGDPVNNTTVTLTTAYKYDGVPAQQVTVTTNSTGQATYTFSVNESAPWDDWHGLELEAYTEYNGSTDTGYASASVSDYKVDTRITGWGSGIKPGETLAYNFSVRDAETGDPVTGAPISLAGETFGFHATAFSPGSNTTASNGVAKLPVRVPSSVKWGIHVDDVGPNESPNSYPYLNVQANKVTVNGFDAWEYTAGSAVEFNYTTDSSSTVSGLVLITTGDQAVDENVIYAKRLAPGTNDTVTIPESVPDGSYYNVEVRTTTESGVQATNREYFQVKQPTRQISGQVSLANGTAATDDFVWAFPKDRSGNIESALTDATGNFTITGLDDDETYVVGYYEGNRSFSESFPRNDSPDMFTLDVVSTSNDVALAPVELPTAYTVNVTVVNESNAPVADANVTFWHNNGDAQGTGWVNNTRADGRIYPNGNLSGMELTGNVSVELTPPKSDRYVNETTWHNVTVTSDRNLTLTLNETEVYAIDTDPASNVTARQVTANGELVGLGGASEVDLSFEYWKKGNKSETYTFVNVETATEPTQYNGTLSGLDPNTTYVVKAVGYSDANGWMAGSAVEFTTAEGFEVDTTNVSSVRDTRATANGSLVNMGGASSVELSFEYWEKGSKSDTYSFVNVESKSEPGSYNGTLPGLAPNTTYIVQAVGYSDANGWTAGDSMEFTTAEAYSVETTGASNVTDSSLRAKGELVSLGGADTVDLNFEYWVKGNKSETYSWASIEQKTAPGTYTGNLTGLSPNTTYVVQAVGYSDANGWTSGSSVEVTTAKQYTVATDSATDVFDRSATLNGELVNLGGADSVELNFQYWEKGNKSATYTWASIETKSAPGSYSSNVSGLKPNTTYVVEAVGYSETNGWTAGESVEFTTAEEYNVTTDPATSVTASSATFNGELVGLGGANEAELNFEYWVKGDKSNTYSWVNAETKTAPGTYASSVDNLASNTTYVVRTVAYTDEHGWETGKTVEVTTD